MGLVATSSKLRKGFSYVIFQEDVDRVSCMLDESGKVIDKHYNDIKAAINWCHNRYSEYEKINDMENP